MTLQEKKFIIVKCLLHSVALFPKEIVDDNAFAKISKFINPELIDERTLLANPRVLNVLDFNTLSKPKVIRLLVRNPELISRVNLKKAGFVLDDLMPLFRYHPDLVDHFDIDFDSMSGIEAINVVGINKELAKRINLEKYQFTKKEVLTIIHKFADDSEILMRINLHSLDHYTTRALIVKTGERYMDNLDMNCLKSDDWLFILQERPDLLQYCNIPVFETNDRFNLVRLVLMFPQLNYLIEQNKEAISALGWEKLLIADPEHYIQICNVTLLRQKNWDEIVRQQPKLAGYRQMYFIV